MSIYKNAVQQKLRFRTPSGSLSAEQLFELSVSELSESIKAVKKLLKNDNNDDDLSFLDETVVVDTTQQLRFDILKDVYITKKKEQDEARSAKDVKEHNQKILALIKDKQENSLKDKSIEELEAMLQK